MKTTYLIQGDLIMRYKILPVQNVSRLREAGDALIKREPGLPGMGLIYGPTGYGKTTAVTWFINQCNGVFVRAMAIWSPKMMLQKIAFEMEIDVKGRNNGEMVEAIILRLAETGRPLFIDEADYIIESKRLTDTLRDIHDLSSSPVILIGMDGIEKRLKRNQQFTGRIAQWVRFEGVDFNDARLLADGLAEVTIKDDLLTLLHKKASPRGTAGAEVRRLVVGLGKIEQYAKSRGITTISANEWTKETEFFIGQAV